MDQKSPEAFRTISEVADWLGVPTHVLRFWESRFSQVKPVKRAGGRRYYRPSDMELLGGIRQLLHEDGMTIRGVQKLLREKGVKHVAEMSPPLDLSADTKDVSPTNVVDLSDRREAESAGAEDAAVSTDEETPWYESGVFAQSAAPEPTAPAPQGAETVEAAAEEPTATEPAATEPPAATETPEPVEAPLAPEAPAIEDPLPDPDTMDFLAHDAAPETLEPEGETAAPAPAEPVTTDPHDPMSSPEALEFAAHEAAPETSETSEAATTSEPGPDEPVEPPAETTTPAAQPPRTAPVMPDIGPDPDDTEMGGVDLITVQLREARRAKTAFNVATLQALADRLDEIAGRMAGGPGGSGSG